MHVYERPERDRRFYASLEGVAVRVCPKCRNRVGVREPRCSRCGTNLEPMVKEQPVVADA
jgi:ribosomal protein L40E